MSRNTGKTPQSYDEIVRQTVVEPDSSVRPTRAQEQAAREGYRALDSDEQALRDRVAGALATAGPGAAGVTFEVSVDLVTLLGRVAHPAMLRVIEDAVAGVAGVSTIHDQVVVDAPAVLGAP
jgi:hypothetical protein